MILSSELIAKIKDNIDDVPLAKLDVCSAMGCENCNSTCSAFCTDAMGLD